MDLGQFSLSLTVKELEVSLDFYQKLGFEVVDGGHRSTDFPDSDEGRWRMLRHKEVRLGLFHGMFSKNVLTFHPSDVRSIQRDLEASGVKLMSETDEASGGSAYVMLEDPDGNPILLDQH